MSKLRSDVTKKNLQVKDKQREFQTMQIEAERFSGDLTSAKELFTENETSIAELQASLSEIGKEHDNQAVNR